MDDHSALVLKLVDQSGDDDPAVRKAATDKVLMLGLGPGEDLSAAVPGLIERLRDKHDSVRQMAAGALHGIKGP